MKWIRGIIAFAAAGTIAFTARELSSRPVEVRSSRSPLVAADAVDPEQVVEIRMTREGTPYRFVLDSGAWKQTQPVPHAIDGWSMRQLIGKLLKTESVRSVPLRGTDKATRDKELAQAGFAPPTAVIELIEAPRDGAEARRVAVELGRRSLAGRAYARVAPANGVDSGYSVIDASLHEYALGRDPKEFRRRDLFPDLAGVDRLTFSSPGGNLVLARSGRDYRLESPVRARADRAQAEELIDALRRARSGGFVTDRPAELSAYGLSPAMATLEVDAGGTRRALLIGDAVSIGAQDRFGMLDGTETVVRLPAAVLAPLLPRVERLIDAVATGVRGRDIGAIEIAAGEVRIGLRRESDGWSATVGRQGDAQVLAGRAETDRVDALIKALSETRASAVEIVAFPADRSVATVTLNGFAGEPLDTVRIARRDADSRLLLENGDGVLRVHSEIDLPLTADELGIRKQ